METSQPRRLPVYHDGFAIASLVLGLCWIGGLGSLLAIIFGAVSSGQARRRGRAASGMAIWGIGLGLLGLLALAVVVALMLNAHHTDPTHQWLDCLQRAIDNGTDATACQAPAQ